MTPTAALKVFMPVRAPRIRLVCCSYAGGNASAYAHWHAGLPDDIEVCAVELPGRGARFREPPLRTMGALADHVMASVLPLVDARIVLFGHSMGGALALELASRLVDVGMPPSALAVSGCAAPHLPSRRRRRLHDLPRDELVQELNLLEGLPAGMLDADAFIDLFLPTIRADLECRETWRAAIRAVPVPVHVLAGADDALVALDDLGEWQRYSSLPVSVRVFGGEHFFIDSHRAEVLAHLREILGEPPASASGGAVTRASTSTAERIA